MPAKPMTANAVNKQAADFVAEHAKGAFGPVLAALFKKLLTAFIAALLQNNDIVPKSGS